MYKEFTWQELYYLGERRCNDTFYVKVWHVVLKLPIQLCEIKLDRYEALSAIL